MWVTAALNAGAASLQGAAVTGEAHVPMCRAGAYFWVVPPHCCRMHPKEGQEVVLGVHPPMYTTLPFGVL